MELLEVIVIALALSFDSFAVSAAASVSGFVRDKRAAFRLAFHFGLFQFLMPIVGYTLGMTVESIIAIVDHWIAFVLLAVVGGRMIKSALQQEALGQQNDPTRGVTLVVLALATSIDAMAVGLSMAILGMKIWYPSVIIGLVTASMGIVAIVGGNRIGARIGNKAQLLGGVVLLLIGVRIVVSHLLG